MWIAVFKHVSCNIWVHVYQYIQKYTLLLDSGLVKGNMWRILLIIDTPDPACRKRRLGGAWRVVRYKWSSNKTGVLGLGSPCNQHSCGRWCSWVWISPPPRTLQRRDDPACYHVCSTFANIPGASGLIFM